MIASKPFWVDYDPETDTLYISFRKPQNANDSMMEEGIIYHYDDKDLVGITVLNAKSYMKNNQSNE
jgi:uncharacterized protein YuzE